MTVPTAGAAHLTPIEESYAGNVSGVASVRRAVVAKVARVAGTRRAPSAGILVEVEPEPVTPE